MANFATRHNRGSLFSIDTTDYEYISPKDLFTDNPGTIFVVGGLYLNSRSKFGPSAVAILPEIHKMLNLPQHMTEEVIEILGNAEDVDDIRNGRVGIALEAYTSRKYNRECIGVNWVDL